MQKPADATPLENLARQGLGSMLMLAGTSHLTVARKEFRAQVPPWLPLSTDRVVVLSGLTEITLGAALAFLPRERIRVGWVAGLFFIAIFPGNIAQLTHHRNAFGLNSDRSRFLRLFFQPVLVAWALWSTGAWKNRRKLLPPPSKT